MSTYVPGKNKAPRNGQDFRFERRKVPIDEQKHLAVGLIVALLAYAVSGLLAAILAATRVGVAK